MNTFKNNHFVPSLNELSAELSSYGRVAERRVPEKQSDSDPFDDPSFFDDTKNAGVPKKKFPKHLKAFLQFIPGNDCCPDCDLRVREADVPREFKTGLPSKDAICMPWANVECGSLICEECAGFHIRLNRRTSSIMSLDSSSWSLPQILSVIEGGNENFLNALKKVDRNHYPNKNKRGHSSRNLLSGKDRDFHPLEYRYKHCTTVTKYKITLASRVADACKKNGGATFHGSTSSIIPMEDVNNGISLATFLVHKSRNGNLQKKDASILIKGKVSDSAPSTQVSLSTSKNIRKTQSKSVSSSESNAVNHFFRRIFEEDIARPQRYDRNKSSSRNHSCSELMDDRKVHFQEQRKDDPKRKNQRYVGDNIKPHNRHRLSLKKDLKKKVKKDELAWSYQKSSGKSKTFKQERRLSIDSMVHPLLMLEETNHHSRAPRPLAA